jgi:acetyltransferase-like isoleucine patch superfamily enzyme
MWTYPVRIKVEIREWYRALLRAIPGEIGCWLRRNFYGFHAGRGTRVLSNTIVYYPERLIIGENVGITAFTQINAGGGVRIGNDVLIGPGCCIWSQNHSYHDSSVPIRSQGYERKEVIIEDDVWVGAQATILPGVILRRGTVVASGAVVTKSTAEYAIVAGVPAKVIGTRGFNVLLSGADVTAG